MDTEENKRLFTNLGLALDREVKPDNLKNLLFCCRDKIGKKRQEEITSFVDLFDELGSTDDVSPGKTTFLKQMFQDTQNISLLNLVEQYEEKRTTQSDSSPDLSPELDQAFEYLEENLGRDWKKFMRKLGMREKDFDKIRVKHPNDLTQQIHCALEMWLDGHLETASYEDLLTALQGCNLNLHAHDLGKKLSTSQ